MNSRASCVMFLLALFTYFEDVAPILNRHCVECHATGHSLNLSRFPFLSVATQDQSAIVDRILIRAGLSNPTMPPGNRPKLSSSEVNVIEQWRDQGLN